jgi:hypothetical protein
MQVVTMKMSWEHLKKIRNSLGRSAWLYKVLRKTFYMNENHIQAARVFPGRNPKIYQMKQSTHWAFVQDMINSSHAPMLAISHHDKFGGRVCLKI